jgi:hypothetical protein
MENNTIENMTDNEAGIALAIANQWDGHAIFRIALFALEDANYHRVSRELIRAWESVEGPLND